MRVPGRDPGADAGAGALRGRPSASAGARAAQRRSAPSRPRPRGRPPVPSRAAWWHVPLRSGLAAAWGAALRVVAALLVGLVLATPARAAEPTDAPGCAAVSELPDTLQVAWVSRLGATAGARTALQVVRVADLRRLVEESGRDPTRVLRALGLVGKRGTAKGTWKVTVFDVKREWLCRPVEGPEDATIAGVAACPTQLQRRIFGTKARSWSGCGYLLDAATGARTLDVFRIEWQDAVAWGFCVLPLRRFLEGA